MRTTQLPYDVSYERLHMNEHVLILSGVLLNGSIVRLRLRWALLEPVADMAPEAVAAQHILADIPFGLHIVKCAPP